MPPTHEECRGRICMICFCKAKELRNVTPNLLELLQHHCGLSYNLEDERIPSSICGTCRFSVQQLAKGKKTSPLRIFDYTEVQLQPFTRSVSIDGCGCIICRIATSKINPQVTGVPKNSVGRPSLGNTASAATGAEPVKLCSFCMSSIGQGQPHNCTRPTRLANMQALMQQASPTFPEQVASSIVRQKFSTAGDLTAGITLSSAAGPPMRVVVNAAPVQPAAQLTAEHIRDLQSDLGLSSRKTAAAMHHIRSALGPTSVQRNVRKALQQIDRQLEDLFAVQQLPFVREERSHQEPQQRWAVVCTDLQTLFQRICMKRKLAASNAIVRVGIDGGGEFLKICVSVFDLGACNDPQGQVTSSRFLSTGVHQAIIIGIATDTQENYHNVAGLWQACGLNQLQSQLKSQFTVACDLKLANILLGLMAHSSSHPCSWCNINKQNLEDPGTMRTIGLLRESYEALQAAGGRRKQAKLFDNVVHPCIVTGSDSTTVLQIIPPPELHLMTGVVQVLYEGLHKVWPDSQEWLVACHVERDQHHGGSFTGNAARKLLRSADRLAAMCPLAALPFVAAFRSFNKVVEACFSSRLDPSFLANIQAFQRDFMDLGISVTPKVHAVFHHVAEYCSMRSTGLGPWSEQCTESLHRDFQQHWLRYKINYSHPAYSEKLLASVISYNSRHL